MKRKIWDKGKRGEGGKGRGEEGEEVGGGGEWGGGGGGRGGGGGGASYPFLLIQISVRLHRSEN